MTQIIYVSCPNSHQIYVWKLDEYKEKLELMQIVCTFNNSAHPIVIHPNKQILYIGVRPNFGITSYHISQEGLLHSINTTQIFISPTYLAINKTGTFLYCASYQYNTVNIISINKSGIIIDSIQIINGLLGCHSVNIDNQEKLLWVPCLKEDFIRIFRIHISKGTLTPFNPNCIIMNKGSGPRHMTFHNLKPYAYVINELNGTISVIKYDLENITTPLLILQTINIAPNNLFKQFWAADIHITPDNRWLYCSDRASNIISCFQICSETKQLRFVNYQITEIQPRGFAIDNTGKFLIVAGQKSNQITLYSIDINCGKLNIISSYPSGIGPIWINVLSKDV